MDIQFWKAALIRAVKTFLQVILALWTTGKMITDVDWKFTLLSAFSAAIYSLITSIVAGLPEVDLVKEVSPTEYEDIEVYDEDEEIVEIKEGE